jgi:hypothetical protein
MKCQTGMSNEICSAVAFLDQIGQNKGHVTRRSTDVSVVIATVTRQIFNLREKYFRQKLHRKLKKLQIRRTVSAHCAALGVHGKVMELWAHLQNCTLDIVNSGQTNTRAVY